VAYAPSDEEEGSGYCLVMTALYSIVSALPPAGDIMVKLNSIEEHLAPPVTGSTLLPPQVR